jgi:hypothetical protein
MAESEVNELVEHCTGNLATDSTLARRALESRRSRMRYPHRAEPVHPRTGIEREFAERDALDSELTTQASVWRDEVASRVDSYRARRSKKSLAGEFSMKFDFEPRPAVQASAAAPKLAMPEIAPVYAEPEPEPQPQQRILPAEPPAPAPEPRRMI